LRKTIEKRATELLFNGLDLGVWPFENPLPPTSITGEIAKVHVEVRLKAVCLRAAIGTQPSTAIVRKRSGIGGFER